MSNIKINDVFQRIQYAATNGQTQFSIPFPFFDNAYVTVWQDGVVINQGAGAGEYGISGAGSPSGGLITLVTPAALNSIITIEGIMPIDRTSIYSATISNLTGSDLNGDFNREVVMMKQIQTTQALLQLQYAPWAVISQDETVTTDRYIPLLPPLGAWRMNAGGTEIETFLTPASGSLAPGDATYILQTADSDLPNAQAMGALASGLVVNTTTTGVQLTRLLAGVANQTAITNASGIAGHPTVGIAANPTIPGTEYILLPSGTTAQRPGSPTDGMVRYNTTTQSLEVYEGTTWDALAGGIVDSVVGTANQIDVDNADPQNPLLSLSATIDAPGTFTIQGTVSLDSIIDDDTFATATDTNIPTSESVKAYVDSVAGGLVDSVTGTANEVDVDNTDPQNPIVKLSSTANLPGTFNIQSSTAVDEIINDNTLATATATNLATALAIKTYVDSIAAGFTLINPVRVASTGNLVATYANGASGVGATLTVTALGVASIDGVALSLNDRVLFKDQSTTFQNGIYYVSDVGSGGTSAVYTRTTDFDQPSEIDPGDLVPVLAGSTLTGTLWLQTATVTAVGTDPITFIQFAAAYTNVVTLTGTQTITGDKTFSGTTTLDNFIFDTNQMQHASDTNNYFEFGTDTQNFVTGGSSRMDLSDTGFRLGSANSRVTTILDEDNMASDSATALATQQSIKAYVDAQIDTTFTTMATQTFSGNETYTPTTGMKFCLVRVVAGGGGGGGADANPGATLSAGSGGGAGSYGEGLFTAAQIGASKAVTIGAGGAAGSAGTGGTGGVSSLGALITTNGGTGGGQGPARSAVAFTTTTGVGGAAGSGGYSHFRGACGGSGVASSATTSSGYGGSSFYGGGASPIVNTTGSGSSSGANGAGGSGASSLINTAQTGGAGTSGYIEIIEFI